MGRVLAPLAIVGTMSASGSFAAAPTLAWTFSMTAAGPDVIFQSAADSCNNQTLVGWVVPAGVSRQAVREVSSSGLLLWSVTLSSAGGSEADGLAVAVASDDSFYTLGRSRPAGQGMNWVLRSFSPARQILWTDEFNSPSSEDDEPLGLVIAPNGDAIVAGAMYRSDLGHGWDWRVVRHARADGGLLWATTFHSGVGSGGVDFATGVDVDASGNVLVVGRKDTPTIAAEIQVVKYTAAGTVIWSRSYAGRPGSLEAVPSAIVVDPAGDVYVSAIDRVSAYPNYDWLVCKFSGVNGNLIWATTYAGASGQYDHARDIELLPDGTVVVAGHETVTGQGTNALVRGYDASGNFLWSKSYNHPSNGDDEFNSVSADHCGNFVVGGAHTVSGESDWFSQGYRFGPDCGCAVPLPAVTVQKIQTPATPLSGDPITYEIRVTNTGGATITSLCLTDTLHPLITMVTTTGPAGFPAPVVSTVSSGTRFVFCGTGLTMTPGTTYTFTMTGIVGVTCASVHVGNTAYVDASDGTASVGGFSNGTGFDVGLFPLMLAVNKTVSLPGGINPGAPVTYRIAVANLGGATVTDLLVVDTISTRITGAWSDQPVFLGAPVTTNTVSGTRFVWSGTGLMMTPGTVYTFTINGSLVGPLAGVTISNTVLVTGQNACSGITLQSAPVAFMGIVPPGAPVGLTAAPVPYGIELQWSAAAAGSSAIASYDILRATCAACVYSPYDSVSDTTFVWDDWSADPIADTWYVVRAVDATSATGPVAGPVSGRPGGAAPVGRKRLLTPNPAPGGTVMYAIDLTNQGTYDTEYLYVADIVPTGVAVTAADGPIEMGAASQLPDPGGTRVEWFAWPGVLPAGRTWTLTITGTASPSATNLTVCNEAYVEGWEFTYSTGLWGTTPAVCFTLTGAGVTPPGVPGMLTAVGHSGPARIELAWTASSAGSYPVSGYEIFRSTCVACPTTLVASTGLVTAWTDFGIAPNAPYTYRVRAVDAVGVAGGLSMAATASATAMVVLPPALIWSTGYNGSANGWDLAWGGTVDACGNLTVVGAQSVTGQGVNWLVRSWAPDGSTRWSASYNDPANAGDEAYAAVADSTGSVIVIGNEQRPDLGQGMNWLVRKYSSTGALLWSRTYNGPANTDEIPLAIAVDTADNVYVTGQSATAVGNLDWMIRKYDPAGNVLMTLFWAGPAGMHDSLSTIVVDPSGSIYVAGDSVQVSEGANWMVQKRTAAGAILWSRTFVAPGLNADDRPFEIGLDGAGNLIVGGTEERVDLGQQHNWRLASWDPEGNLRWVTNYNGPSNGRDKLQTVSVEPSGRVIAGGYESRSDLGQGDNWLVRSYDSTGTLEWSMGYNGVANGNDEAHEVIATPWGAVYVVGMETVSGQAQNWLVRRYGAGAPAPCNVPPGAPTGLVGYPTGELEVAVTWSPATPGSYPISAYEVWRSTSGSAGLYSLQGSVGAGATTWIQATDLNGLGGYYEVRAIDTQGVAGPFSTRVPSFTVGCIPKLEVSMSSSMSQAGGNDIVEYRISFSNYAECSAMSVHITTQEPNFVGRAFVSTIASAWVSGNPAPITYTGWATALPGPWNSTSPAGLTAPLYMRWIINQVGMHRTGYIKYRAQVLPGSCTLQESSASATLTSGWPNYNAWGPTYASVTNTGNCVPGIPAGLSALGGTNAIALSWQPAWPGQNPVSGYEVFRASCATCPSFFLAATTATAYADAPVLAGIPYSYTVRAIDTVGVTGGLGGPATASATAMVVLPPALIWSTGYNGSSNGFDLAWGGTVDACGNLTAVGVQSVTGQGANWLVRSWAPDGSTRWSASYNNPANAGDEAYAAVADSVGNVVVAGAEQRPDLGQGVNWLVRKYSSTGALLWSRTYNGPANVDERPSGIAVDTADNVYVAGQSATGASNLDWMIRKYDPAGNVLMTLFWAGAAGMHDGLSAIVVDPSGSLYVAGDTVQVSEGANWMVQKRTAAGAILWSRTFASPAANADDRPAKAGLDGAGNLIVGGAEERLDLGQQHNWRLASWDPEGNLRWVTNYNGPSNGRDLIQSVSVEPGGRVIVGGYESRSDLGQADNWLIRSYDSTGTLEWSMGYNGVANGNDEAHEVIPTPWGALYVTGMETVSGQAQNWLVRRYGAGTPPVCNLPPGAPAAVTALPVAGDIALAWTPAVPGSFAISGYEVWRATCSGCGFALVSAVSATGWLDVAVPTGTPLFYQVRAVDTQGTFGPFGPVASATVSPCVPMLELAMSSSPADAMAGDEVEYRISFSNTADCSAFAVTITTGPENFAGRVVAPPVPGAAWVSGTAAPVVYLGWAKDSAGPWFSSTYTGQAEPFYLRWILNRVGMHRTGYVSYRAQVLPGSCTLLSSSASATLWSGFPDFIGWGPVSASVMTSANCIAPSAPVSVSAICSGVDLWLYWTPSVPGYNPVSAYEIWRATFIGGPTVLIATTAATTWLDSPGVPGGTFEYWLRATDTGGLPGPWGPSGSATLPGNQSPPTPGWLTAVPGPGVVRLEWSLPDPCVCVISSYRIWRSTCGACPKTVHAVVDRSVTVWLDGGLDGSVTYEYEVEPVNSWGTTGTPTNARTGTPVVPPPATLVTTPRPEAVQLEWGAFDPCTCAVSAYQIWRGTCGGCPKTLHVVVGPSVTIWLDGGLTGGGTYEYEVRAVDDLGNVSPPSPGSGTIAGPPAFLVGISKDLVPAGAALGAPLSYRITVRNLGSIAIDELSVWDTVPPEVTGLSTAAPAVFGAPVITPAGSGTLFAWSATGLGLAQGASLTITVTGIAGPLAGPATVCNVAGARGANGPDEDLAFSAPVCFTATPSAQLAQRAVISVGPVTSATLVATGQWVTVELTVTNTGSCRADVIVSSLTVTGTCAGYLEVIFLPTICPKLEAGESYTFSWTFSVSGSGTLDWTAGSRATESWSGLTVMPPPVTRPTTTAGGQATARTTITLDAGSCRKNKRCRIVCRVVNTGDYACDATSATLYFTGDTFIIPGMTGPEPTGPIRIEPGTSTEFAWTFTPTGPGDLCITANALGYGLFGTPVTGTTVLCIAVVDEPAITVVKDQVTAGLVGSPLRYRVIVTNTGGVTMTDLVVSDTVSPVVMNTATDQPAGFGAPVVSSVASGTRFVWTGSALAFRPGTAYTFTITGSVGPVCVSTPVGNLATVMASDPEGGVAGLSNPVSVTVAPPSTGLAVSLVQSPPVPVVGGPVSYTIVVTNAGTATLTALWVADTLSPVITGVTASQPGGFGPPVVSAAGASGTRYGWSASGLSFGPATAWTFTLTGVVGAPCAAVAISTTAVVTASGACGTTTMATNPAGFALAGPVFGVTLVKKQSPAAPGIGAFMAYEIHFTNTGTAALDTVTIVDTVPAVMMVQTTRQPAAFGAPAVTAVAGGSRYVWSATGVNLLPGATLSVTLTGRMGSVCVPTEVSNTAYGIGSAACGSAAGFAAPPGTVVQPHVTALWAQLVQTPAVPVAGGPVEYRIVVRNIGTSTIATLTVTDTVPLGVLVTSTAQPAGFSLATAAVSGGTRFEWTGAGLALFPGATFTFTLTGLAPSACVSVSVSNTGHAAGDAGCATASATTNAAGFALTGVTLSAGVTLQSVPAEPVAGGPVTWRILVSNTGTATITDLLVSDTIPALVGSLSVAQPAGFGAPAQAAVTGGRRLVWAATGLTFSPGTVYTFTVTGSVGTVTSDTTLAHRVVSTAGLACAQLGVSSNEVSSIVRAPVVPPEPVEAGRVKIVGGIRGYINPKRGEQSTILIRPEAAGEIVVRIYDQEGVLVWSERLTTTGGHTEVVQWRGVDSAGREVSPGLYPILIEAPGIRYRDTLIVVR